MDWSTMGDLLSSLIIKQMILIFLGLEKLLNLVRDIEMIC